MQKLVAETQTDRNDRENESCFREHAAEQDSSPVDSGVTHFPTPAVHGERRDSNPPIPILEHSDYFRFPTMPISLAIPPATAIHHAGEGLRVPSLSTPSVRPEIGL